ncbi:MAG TPA: Type 1 glutamine amidotransferase-like domain-containing protein [Candidatus Tumulicola sp.]|jgi:dipeptidase E
MKLLLTSSGARNASIQAALVDLLDKPIAESNALVVVTGIYPFAGGPYIAYKAICGEPQSPMTQSTMTQLGWKSVGLLELTALPTIDNKTWSRAVEEADAILVWGGDPVYLSHWMRESGLTDLLSTLPNLVYVGVSAGSMTVASTFGETYDSSPIDSNCVLTSRDIEFATPQGNTSRLFVTARGAGFVDFAIVPHLNHPDHEDASLANAEKWASMLPVPVYAIDDQTAIRVKDGNIEVISEGDWRLFSP